MMKVRFGFFFLPALAFLLCACPSSKRSKKEMVAELQLLRAQNARDSKRIESLEVEIENQNKLDEIEKEQQKLQAEFENYRDYFQKKNEDMGDLKITEPSAPVQAPAPDENNQGFSFVAVRSIAPAQPPAPQAAAPASVQVSQASSAPVTTGTQKTVSGQSTNSSPEALRLAALRQQLRYEITIVFDQIRARRSLRYGEKDGNEDSDTYVKLKSYDPETGRNKKGGKKPPAAVDLENGLNQERPENSACLDSMSLASTFVHARLIRDEIIELKNQTGLQ